METGRPARDRRSAAEDEGRRPSANAMANVHKDAALRAVIYSSLAITIGSILALLAIVPLADSLIDSSDHQRLHVQACTVCFAFFNRSLIAL